MSRTLVMSLTAVSHSLVTRNRKVSHHLTGWWRALISVLVLAALLVVVISIFWAYGNLKYVNLSYQISQAQEIQKQYLELNRKLKVELAHLTAVPRLEKLAVETFHMAPPQPHQVVNLP